MFTNQLAGQPSADYTIAPYTGPTATCAIGACLGFFKRTKNDSSFSPRFDELMSEVIQGRAAIWVVTSERGVVAVAVTSVCQLPSGPVIQFRYGHSLDSAASEFGLDAIVAWAKTNNIKTIELEGRAGFARRLFPKFGNVKQISCIYRVEI